MRAGRVSCVDNKQKIKNVKFDAMSNRVISKAEGARFPPPLAGSRPKAGELAIPCGIPRKLAGRIRLGYVFYSARCFLDDVRTFFEQNSKMIAPQLRGAKPDAPPALKLRRTSRVFISRAFFLVHL